jgi:hypothetical protein
MNPVPLANQPRNSNQTFYADHDQPSFCRTLSRISSESRGSCTARANTTPPIIAAARKMASFRSPSLAERISSSPCSNAALISGVERATSWASAATRSYARGMTTREIQGQLEEIYGIEVSPTLISNVTDAVIEEVKL